MAPPTIGFGSAVAIGDEQAGGTYGTPVACTHLLKVQSHSCTLDVGIEEVPTLGDHQTSSGNAVESTATLTTASGSITFPFYANDNSVLLMLAMMFGAVADGGAGPSSYTHTFTIDNRSSTRKYATFEHVHGDGDQKTMEGCVVNDWSLTVEAGRPAMLTVNYIAENGAALTTATNLSHYSGELLIGNDGGVLAWNAINHVPRKVTISCNHNYTRRHVVGSAFTLQPVINARTTVTVEAELEHGVLTDPEAAYVAGTIGDLTFALTAGGGEVHTFTLHNGRIIRGIQRNVSGFGIVPKSVLWRGFADAGSGGDNGLTLAVTNSSIATFSAV